MQLAASGSRVALELDPPMRRSGWYRYLAYKRALAATDRTLQISFDQQPKFSVMVPRGVFNPYVDKPDSQTDAKVFLELVLGGGIDVRDKRVVDLGCGCGVIGIASIIAGARSVLFTDINPNVAAIRESPLLRPQDVVRVQDLLVGESASSYDVVIMSVPNLILRDDNEAPPDDSIDSAMIMKRDLIFRMLDESARVLAPGGLLVTSLSLPLTTILPAARFFAALNQSFELQSFQIISAEDVEHPARTLLRWISKRYLAYGANVCADRQTRLAFSVCKRSNANSAAMR